ncbi:LOW QUALITY PROTEIN: CD44 antigen [Xyrauchen texanus]|uniref:LOW QUALITY PROTEIN: CD44 antigen n=1 Tax=Xyrauchen texanus TaxID=154827 RepID=UPI0022418D78|nr:LOW QUALITY PROTEIN: CD44 antigen [Xyrauchen texanus]
MWTLILVFVATGLPALLQAAPAQGNSGRCSIASVLYVEGTSHYSLTFHQALELCQNSGYKLATVEQVIEAFKNGLRTCRYGWIDGQKVTFLPHINDPNCDSSSTEVTFHAEETEYLSDVYCFNPSDSFDQNCKDSIKSEPETYTNGNTVTTNRKPNDDILKEAETEGFLVDEEKTKQNKKRAISPMNDDVIPTPGELIRINLMGSEDFSTAKSDEEPIDMEAPETVHMQNATHILGDNSVTQTTVPDIDNMNMKPYTLPYRNRHRDTKGPTNKPHFGKSSSSIIPNFLLPETEGSGSGSYTGILSEETELTHFTTRPVTTGAADKETIQKKNEEVREDAPKQDTNSKVPPKSRKQDVLGADSPSTPTGQVGEGTPTWLIIFAFCVVVGAILCLFAAIATKDMWYGPRQSKNITSEEYSKAATLPLSEKEQEMVTLMSVGNLKNDTKEDITITCVDEHEREYLMQHK